MVRFGVDAENEHTENILTDLVYIVSLYQGLGVTGGMPLVLGAAYVTIATLSNFTGAILLDKVGRKPLFSMSQSYQRAVSRFVLT